MHQDCVGSFNFFSNKLWGSFLLKKKECENALAKITDDAPNVTFNYLDRKRDEALIHKVMQDWARADSYILF